MGESSDQIRFKAVKMMEQKESRSRRTHQKTVGRVQVGDGKNGE